MNLSIGSHVNSKGDGFRGFGDTTGFRGHDIHSLLVAAALEISVVSLERGREDSAMNGSSALLEKLDGLSFRFREKSESAAALVGEICERYLADSATVALQLSDLITPARVKKLLAASGYMAEQAASLKDLGWFDAGLTCHAILADRAEPNEHNMHLVILTEAAKHVPCSFEERSAKIQAKAEAKGRAVLADFDLRDPVFNKLSSMGLKTVEGPEGLTFTST